MKVLHVFDHSIPLHSGYTFRSRNIIKHQHMMGIETCHVTSPKQANSNVNVENVGDLTFYRSDAVPAFWRRLPVFNQLAVIPILKRTILRAIPVEKPDIIHAHSPALNGIAALRAAKQRGLPLVYEVRAFWEDAAVSHGTAIEWGMRYRLTRAMETHVLTCVDAVTCICEGLKSDIEARGIKSNKVTVIPNAVNLEEFTPINGKNQELQQQLALQGRLVLGFIGSFYEYEGLDLLINALPQVIQELPDIRLLLVGGGQHETLLRQLVGRHNLEDFVLFTGRVPHEQISDYYSLVDLLVYPRKSMRLTDLVTPLKPLEAMALGIPVLASDVGGHRELIDSNKNGYLFNADDIDSLANNIVRIMLDSHDEIIAAGRHYVKAVRNWTSSVNRYNGIYQRLKE